MTVASFALVLLASGYMFLRLWQLSKSHLVRSDGHTLYFLVVWAAFGIGLVSLATCHDIFLIPAFGKTLESFTASALRSYVTEEKNVENVVRFGIVAFLSIPLSIVLATLFNIPLKSFRPLCSSLLFRISSVTELECFLWEATERSSSVMITLGSGKTYVGNAIEAPSPGQEKKWIRIEPLLSGFRDDKQKFEVTTSYLWIYDQRNRVVTEGKIYPTEDFDILLPTEGIQSVHSFDMEVFEKSFRAIPTQAKEGDSVAQTDPLQHAAKHRETRHRRMSLAEWFYFSYVLAIGSVPVAFFFEIPFLAACLLCYALLMTRLFAAVGRHRKTVQAGTS